jgi:plasmid stabilization system protein ParE
MYTIKITRIAEEDLLEIIQYISEKLKSPIAASSLLDLIEQKIIILEDSPFSCKLIDDDYFRKKEIRFLQVKNYLIFFKINKDMKEISIIRILYARRDWVNILKESKVEE